MGWWVTSASSAERRVSKQRSRSCASRYRRRRAWRLQPTLRSLRPRSPEAAFLVGFRADFFAALRAAAKTAKVPLTEIGEIARGRAAQFLDGSGKPLLFKRLSFSHF